MEKCFSTISTSKKAKKEINRTKKVSYLFFLLNLILWRLWSNIFAKKKKVIEIFSLSSALPGVFHPPRTKRRASPPGLPGLFSPGLWPGSPLPAFGRVDFCRCPGGRTSCVLSPGSLEPFPPGFARLDRSPGSGSVSVGQIPASAGGSPGLSLSEKSNLLLFFGGKT